MRTFRVSSLEFRVPTQAELVWGTPFVRQRWKLTTGDWLKMFQTRQVTKEVAQPVEKLANVKVPEYDAGSPRRKSMATLAKASGFGLTFCTSQSSSTQKIQGYRRHRGARRSGPCGLFDFAASSGDKAAILSSARAEEARHHGHTAAMENHSSKERSTL